MLKTSCCSWLRDLSLFVVRDFLYLAPDQVLLVLRIVAEPVTDNFSLVNLVWVGFSLRNLLREISGALKIMVQGSREVSREETICS